MSPLPNAGHKCPHPPNARLALDKDNLCLACGLVFPKDKR